MINVELSNENDFLNEKIKFLEVKIKRLHGAVMCFEEKENVSSRHKSLLLMIWKRKMKCLGKRVMGQMILF